MTEKPAKGATQGIKLFSSSTPPPSCDGRVVKALDLKSNGVSPHRFEPCSQRYLFFFFLLCEFIGGARIEPHFRLDRKFDSSKKKSIKRASFCIGTLNKRSKFKNEGSNRSSVDGLSSCTSQCKWY